MWSPELHKEHQCSLDQLAAHGAMSQDAEQQGLHCCICLEDSADDKWVALSQCGHMLHAHCLDSFCACRMADGKAPFCPKCRVRSM